MITIRLGNRNIFQFINVECHYFSETICYDHSVVVYVKEQNKWRKISSNEKVNQVGLLETLIYGNTAQLLTVTKSNRGFILNVHIDQFNGLFDQSIDLNINVFYKIGSYNTFVKYLLKNGINDDRSFYYHVVSFLENVVKKVVSKNLSRYSSYDLMNHSSDMAKELEPVMEYALDNFGLILKFVEVKEIKMAGLDKFAALIDSSLNANDVEVIKAYIEHGLPMEQKEFLQLIDSMLNLKQQTLQNNVKRGLTNGSQIKKLQ